MWGLSATKLSGLYPSFHFSVLKVLHLFTIERHHELRPTTVPTCPPPLLFFLVSAVGPTIATTGHRFDPACPLRVTKESHT